MSLTLDQMGQILASAMTSFPTVGTAVTVLRSRLTSSSSVAVEPQVVSKAETKDYKTNYVAYVVIPSGVKSVYLALRKYAVSIVAFPQQKLTIKFDGGKINCDLAKGVSISTSDRQNYTGRDYFDGFEISRNAGEDHNFDHYVPFYFRYLTKGNSISKKSKMDVGSAHIYIRPSNVTIPELNIAEDLTSTYRAAGYIGGSQRVYECTVKACHTNSYLLQADTQLVEVSMEGVMQWNTGGVRVLGGTCVRVPLCKTNYQLLILDLVAEVGVEKVRISLNPVTEDGVNEVEVESE